jgi:hypothetical protein
MNLFNRVFTIVLIVILMILGLGVIFLSDNMIILSTNLLNLIKPVDGVIRALVGVAYLVLMFFLLWLEFRRPGSRTVEVARSSGGRIRITTSHVEERIAQQVDALSGVIAARVRVNERDNAVVANLDVQATPDVDLIAKGEEIAAITRIAVQDQLGLKLYGKPNITLKTNKAKTVQGTPVTPPDSSDNTNPSERP